MAANRIENAPIVELGELIEQTDLRNSDNKYTEDDVKGISTEKKFISTKANLDGVSLSSYKIVLPREFVYVADTSRRGDKIALALNDSEKGYLISSIYTTFCSKDENILLPEYLYLLLSRTEFDRYSRFNSWGSARETFDWAEMSRVKIPLPSIETQRELVAVYNGLKELAEENEKLLEPLSKSCEAFIVDCKKKYPAKRLGDMIEQVDERNEMLKQVQHDTTRLHEETVCHPELVSGSLGIESVRGISTEKAFINTKADMSGVSLTSYKIVKPNEFVYVADTSRRGEKIALALNGSNDSYLVSSIYTTFKSKNENILRPAYLYLLLSRSEFDRYSRFNSWGSARETFDWSEMCRVQIPLPPIQIQQKIVDLYNCYEECKRIANEAREKISNLCPALVQKAAHTY
nr:restriction endonuclease subunit S [uncultured Treponema sp.]